MSGAGFPEPPFPRVVRRRLAEGGLAGDALSGVGAAAGLFAAPPAGPEAVACGLPGARPNPDGGAATFLPASAFSTTSDAAARRLEAALAGKGHVVTAGQQPGLFLGPLYTLYKALTAVRTAAALGSSAVAVFWIASDDHDWDEVAACRILDGRERLVTLRLEPPPRHAGRSVGEAPLPPEVEALLDRLRKETGGAVAGAPPPWLDALREAYRPGRSFGEAFARALGAALRGHDVALLDSADPELRRRAARLYRRIVERPELVIEAMESGRRAVRDAGYEPALTPPPEGVQIFHDDGRARHHLLRSDAAFDAGGERLSRDELLRRLETSPASFTPAAALRPVVESWLLPVAATVLGPGEIAYWAQLEPLFDALEVPMPRIVARDAWTLVEPRIDRLLDKLGLDVSTVEAEGEGIDARWIARSRPPGVRAALESMQTRLDEESARLDEAVGRELPGLRSAAGKAAHRIREATEELSRTVDARVREREAIALRQAARLRSHLLPGGRPQERAVAAAQFLARHGRGLVDDLLKAAEPPDARVAAPREQD